MNKSVLAGIVIVGILAAAGGGYWFGQQRGAPAPGILSGGAPGNAVPAQGKGAGGQGGSGAPSVEAVQVTTAQMSKAITAVGSLRSDESITVRPEVAGRVAFIGFQEGQRVPKGATLLRLDPAINQAEVQQAQANLTLAKAKYERALELQGKGFISGQAKDEAENNLKVGEAALALANARLAKTEIKAPFSGVIGLRSISVGDYVKEGADMVNLESIDALKVDFRVPEIYLKQVSVGQTLQVTLDALPGKIYEGKVFAINPLVDAAGRAIVIRAQVKNTDTALRPGMFARVRLFTKTVDDALVLPEQALVPQGEDQYVFRIVDGKANRVKVVTGQRRDGMVEITGGIAAGDTVVSAGQLKLRDGSPVAIAGAGAGKPAGTTAAGATPGGANAGAPVKGAAMAAPAKADGATAGAAPRS
jgi:membrane fusion protein (multidrug efflux system)